MNIVHSMTIFLILPFMQSYFHWISKFQQIWYAEEVVQKKTVIKQTMIMIVGHFFKFFEPCQFFSQC